MKLKFYILTCIIFISTISFSQNIKKVDGLYLNENGMKYSGVYVSYFDNKNKETVFTIKKGVEHGSAEFYYSTSQIMEQGSFNNGQKDGKWVRWSVDGNKLAEANYNQGKKDGKWIIWDERGVKRYEMFYDKGSKTGDWIMWDGKGQIANKKSY